MTLDELEEVFDAEFSKHRNFRREGKRAGIAAVVRALRDEMWRKEEDVIWLNEILGEQS